MSPSIVTETGPLLRDMTPTTRGVVAIIGEPGIGKTRALEALCADASNAGFGVLTGRGADLEQEVPFGLIIDAFDGPLGVLSSRARMALGPQRLAELAAVLPSLSGTAQATGSTLPAERYRLHHAFRLVLELLARERRLLVALDDVQWADPTSLELVSHLTVRGIPGALLALAYRQRGAPAPLLSAVALAKRESRVRTFEPAPLTLEEAAELVGTGLDPATLAALHAESGGNPFYVQQLACAVGRATEAPLFGGALSANAPAAPKPELPAAVRAAIAQELAVLSPAARRLSEAAAVAGDPFDIDLVREIADLAWADAVAALDELVALGVVLVTEVPGRLRFRHPIVRRAVYAAAGPGSRLSAHRRAAGALERRGAAIGTRAHHVERSAAGGDEQAVALLTEAGEAAAARAPAAAVCWFEAATRLLPDTAPPSRRLSLLICQAKALAAVGRLRSSRRVLERALWLVAANPAAIPNAVQARAALVTMIARTDQGLGRADVARRFLSESLSQATPGSAEAAALALDLAENHMMTGEWDSGARAAANARRLAEGCGDLALLLVANATLALFDTYLSEIGEAQGALDEAVRMIDELADQELTPRLLEALATIASVESMVDRLDSSAGHCERGLRVARAGGQSYVVLRFTVMAQARICLLSGRLGEARRAASSAAEAARLLDNDYFLGFAQALECRAATFQGDLGAALAAGAGAVDAAARAPSAMYAWLASVSYGEALIAAGQHEQGRERVLAAGGPELARLPPTLRPTFTKPLVIADLATGRIDEAETIAHQAEAAAAASGLRSRIAAACDARACVLLARGEPRLAAAKARSAAVAYRSVGWRVSAGDARLTAGHALLAAAEPAAARQEFELAHAALDACGAGGLAGQAARELRQLGKRIVPRPRVRAAANHATAELTQREHDVVARVVQGYTNRQIAAELYLSEKTIERHLTAIFAKLRVPSRTALAALVERGRVQHGAFAASLRVNGSGR